MNGCRVRCHNYVCMQRVECAMFSVQQINDEANWVIKGLFDGTISESQAYAYGIVRRAQASLLREHRKALELAAQRVPGLQLTAELVGVRDARKLRSAG